MDSHQIRTHVGELRRARRRSRLLSLLVVVTLGAAIVVPVVWGDQLACRYAVSREGYSVPDLEGLTLAQARATVRSCVDVEPVRPDRPDPRARVVDQDPAPPRVIGSDRTIQVTLESAE